jgi:hypothetical protein
MKYIYMYVLVMFANNVYLRCWSSICIFQYFDYYLAKIYLVQFVLKPLIWIQLWYLFIHARTPTYTCTPYLQPTYTNKSTIKLRPISEIAGETSRSATPASSRTHVHTKKLTRTQWNTISFLCCIRTGSFSVDWFLYMENKLQLENGSLTPTCTARPSSHECHLKRA